MEVAKKEEGSMRKVQRPERLKRIRRSEKKFAPAMQLATSSGDTRIKIDWDKSEFSSYSMTFIKKLSKIASHQIRERKWARVPSQYQEKKNVIEV